MRKALGYLLYGLGLLIFWPVQIGLGLYGLYYIIMAFINTGVVAGLISIPIVGIILAIIGFIIHILATPYTFLTSWLLEGEERKKQLALQRIQEQEDKKARSLEFEKEMAYIRHQWKKSYIAQGMSEEEAEIRVKKEEEAMHERV